MEFRGIASVHGDYDYDTALKLLITALSRRQLPPERMLRIHGERYGIIGGRFSSYCPNESLYIWWAGTPYIL